MSVALIVIYNHKYERNIEIVENIYKKRFSHIYHLVPFYKGDRQNAIAVYESSYYFQGYVAQGFRNYFQEEYEHYFFIADDMIINPAIDESNYKSHFKLNEGTGFIQSLDSLPNGNWQHNRKAVSYDPASRGCEVTNELLPVEEAGQMLSHFNVSNHGFSFKQTYLWNDNYKLRNLVKQLFAYFYDRKFLQLRLNSVKYPMAVSYSDIFIVSKKSIEKFIHYCGVFAATELWVELAVPTAMMFSGEKIITEKDIALRGKALWGNDVEKELNIYNLNLKKLLQKFPAGYIFIHPVKLSRWNCEL